MITGCKYFGHWRQRDIKTCIIKDLDRLTPILFVCWIYLELIDIIWTDYRFLQLSTKIGTFPLRVVFNFDFVDQLDRSLIMGWREVTPKALKGPLSVVTLVSVCLSVCMYVSISHKTARVVKSCPPCTSFQISQSSAT